MLGSTAVSLEPSASYPGRRQCHNGRHRIMTAGTLPSRWVLHGSDHLGATGYPSSDERPHKTLKRKCRPASADKNAPGVVLDKPPVLTSMLGIMINTGTVVTGHDLTTRGFVPHELAFRTLDFTGTHCEWDTIGVVPDSPGLYAFVLTKPDRAAELHVAYVGRTSNLWMVTKGRLPRSGGARGPQRYGRWKHAGVTRGRINGLVTEAKRSGWDVAHWLSALLLDDIALHQREQDLIQLWNLRAAGWNRG